MYSLNSALEVGDIILIRGGKLHSKAIARVTGGHFSHTCLCIRERTIIEAITSTGVQYSSVVRFVFNNKENVAILRPRFPDEHSKMIFQKAIQIFALDDLGKIYDYFGAVSCMSDKAGENKEEEKFFCSQLVASLFYRAGFSLFDAPSGKINPNQYLHNEKLDNVTDVVLGKIPEYVLRRYERQGRKICSLDSTGSSRSESHSILSDYFKAVVPVFKKHGITPPMNIPETVAILTDPNTLSISTEIDMEISKQFDRMNIIEKIKEVGGGNKIGDDLDFIYYEIEKYGLDFILEEIAACTLFIKQAMNTKKNTEMSLYASFQVYNKLGILFSRNAVEYYETIMFSLDHAIACEHAILSVLQEYVRPEIET